MGAKAKQGELPGTEPTKDKDLIQAANTYKDHMDDRMESLRKERDAKAVVIALMKSKKMSLYSYRGLTIQLDQKDVLKVRRPGDTEPEDGEGEGEGGGE